MTKTNEKILDIMYESKTNFDSAFLKMMKLHSEDQETLRQLILKRTTESWGETDPDAALSTTEIKCITEADINEPDKPISKSGKVVNYKNDKKK